MAQPWPIRWWLVSLSLAVGLPLLVLVGWMFARDLQRERREARESALRIARETAARLRSLHAESLTLLDLMAARPARHAESTCDELFAVVDFFPQYVNLFLFTPDGQLVCTADPEGQQARLSIGAARWVESELSANRLTPGRPLMRLIEGQWVSVLSARAPSGVLVLVQLPDILGPEALLRGGTLTIIDGEGTVLARSTDPERWLGRSVRGTEVTELVLRKKEGRAEARGIDGVERQYGFTDVPEMGWYVYAGVPTAVVMGPVETLALRGLAAGSVVALLAVLLALRVARAIQQPIDELAWGVHVIAREGFSTTVAVSGPREVTTLAEAFNEMIHYRSDAEARLTESERKLKALSDRLLAVQEEERTRIARELHDDLGQTLTALKMDVQGILDRTDSGPPELRRRILRTIEEATGAVQRISAELRPSVLDDLGLATALEAEARLFEERTGIECDLTLSFEEEKEEIGAEASTIVYRIVQEALTNVARHSNARRVEIRLERRDGDIVLGVRDDGRGITEEEIRRPSSLGLIGIRERAAMLDGSVEIEGVADRGTLVSVRFPIRSAR